MPVSSAPTQTGIWNCSATGSANQQRELLPTLPEAFLQDFTRSESCFRSGRGPGPNTSPEVLGASAACSVSLYSSRRGPRRYHFLGIARYDQLPKRLKDLRQLGATLD